MLSVECITQVENNHSLNLTGNYSTILQNFNLEYKNADYYWQVGEITKVQGWILHISIVISQIEQALKAIIPLLAKERLPFKIVKNQLTADDLLNGHFGLAQIGKIICIYPNTDLAATNLAKQLIELTKSYKGPAIPTDVCLGNVVYTRYGSFNPIITPNENGAREKYIYDGKGQLIKDSYAIPFQLPHKIPWPFKDLAGPILQNPPNFLNHLYKLIDILKADPRGNVFKGLYLKNLFQVKNCVIKQGFSNMCSDMAGRDIQDRLTWQYELHQDLSPVVPLPLIYNLLKETNSTVLAMEFIKGDSLFDKLAKDNPLSKGWQELPVAQRLLFLSYLIKITDIIDKIHKRGYVHRDVVPVNFLIDKKDRITLIDVELAYSLKQNRPNPPFSLGTFGFMSPEQAATHPPTVREDVYGLGATLLFAFTGILPIKFNAANTEELIESLYFFIGHKELARTVASCIKQTPNLRPSITMISQSLAKYQTELQKSSKASNRNQYHQGVDAYILREIIASALEGMTKPPVVVSNGLWYSKQITIENYTSQKNKQYAINPGFTEGISGILYVLARIHKAGISIEPCKSLFLRGWEYLEANYINGLYKMSAGLYQGKAGIALALEESIGSGLLEDTELNRSKIDMCINVENDKIHLANGIAGQGLCLLRSRDLLSKNTSLEQLNRIIDCLLSKQQKNGFWQEGDGWRTRKQKQILNIGYDDTGIIWLLLQYNYRYPNITVRNAVINALNGVVNNKQYLTTFYRFVASKESYELGDGGKGLIVLFIKAYELLQDVRYKKIAEAALWAYPRRITHNNFTQENGLAAIGELYLEAWRVFRHEEWMHRAESIANVFLHTIFRATDDSVHWIMEQNNPPTADFFLGNSGIIHFLARYLNPDGLSYRVLNC